ncbi:MAG: acyl-CoA dehydrogenase family protein [Deltaproteobacteria bacterium]|nr:acyl-CoA dehydrogenase family protein [Deltaproteobacteria bacterium]
MDDISRQRQLVEAAGEFANREIRPRAGEIDKRGIFPRDLIDGLAEKGFLVPSVSEEYGGLGLDPVHYGHFLEEIGKACCSTRTLITVNNSLIGETIVRWGSEEQRRTWLPLIASGKKIGAFALSEPNIGTDARSVETEYKEKRDMYVIDGKKKWISFAGIADFFLVIASGPEKATAFFVEREFHGVKTRPIEGMLAGRASHIAEIEFDSVTVPPENVLGRVGAAFPYVVGTALDHGRYSVAWGGVALAQEALEAMVSYSRKRVQFGKKISDFQLIRGMIADAVTKIHAARALCLKAGEMRRDKETDAIVETTIAKYFASKVAMEVAMDAVQIHGANGCQELYPVERLFREAKLLEIIEGTSQIQQEIIGKYGLKKYS